MVKLHLFVVDGVGVIVKVGTAAAVPVIDIIIVYCPPLRAPEKENVVIVVVPVAPVVRA